MTRLQASSSGGRSNAVPILIVATIAFLAIGVAYFIVSKSSAPLVGLGFFEVPIVLALLPVAAIVAFRWPLIFPFGLWVALLPFDLILGVGSDGSGGTVTRYVEIATIGLLALRIIATRKMLVTPRSWLGWVVLVGWMSLTALWSIGAPRSQAALMAIVPLFIMLTVVSVYPISVKEMRGVLIAIVLGSLGAAAYGFNLYQHGQLSDDSRLTLMTDSGIVMDANFFATSFLLPIAICVSVVVAHRALWLKVLAGAATFAMLASIFLSGSRGAFVSVAIVLVYFMIRMRNRVAMLALAAGSGLIFLAFPTMLRRLTESQTNANGSGRTFIWSVGVKALANHWIGGTGIGTFPLAYDRTLNSVGLAEFEGWSRPAHNVIVGCSVELGLFGAALVLIAWFLSFRQASSIARSSANFPLRVAAEGVILGLFVNALFIDPFVIKYFWLAFMIPIMLHNVEHAHPVRRVRPVADAFVAHRVRRFALIPVRRRPGVTARQPTSGSAQG